MIVLRYSTTNTNHNPPRRAVTPAQYAGSPGPLATDRPATNAHSPQPRNYDDGSNGDRTVCQSKTHHSTRHRHGRTRHR